MKKNNRWIICLLFILFCTQSTFATPDFIDNDDGTVTHKVTGLMWMRCLTGQTWTGSICSGEVKEYTWNEAMSFVIDFAGHSDWRLPNLDELLSIIEKGKENPAINTIIFPTPSRQYSVWSSTSPWFDAGERWMGVHLFSDGDDIATGGHNPALLVRGKQWHSGYAKRKKDERQNFLKHLKEGDDIYDGIVIEVKGNLVKIQTNESQCTQRDYDGDCRNYMNTTAEKWVKKSDVYPRN